MTYILHLATALVSLGLLALNLWPGAIWSLTIAPILCVVTFPLLCLVLLIWMLLVIGTAYRQYTKGIRVSPSVVACVTWMALTAVLVAFDVPRVVAFWCYRDEFAALATNAPVSDRGVPLQRWVGCFYIDQYGADGQGAVYFRTVSHADGIGPDIRSYGFALLPETGGHCPFGRSGREQSLLFGDWYSFSISDD